MAIACFIGGWLAPELEASLAVGAGLLMEGVLTPNEALAGLEVKSERLRRFG